MCSPFFFFTRPPHTLFATSTREKTRCSKDPGQNKEIPSPYIKKMFRPGSSGEGFYRGPIKVSLANWLSIITQAKGMGEAC